MPGKTFNFFVSGFLVGIKACLKPNLLASFNLASMWPIDRTSADRPISPNITQLLRLGKLYNADRIAVATARSAPGSDTFNPPATFKKTSFPEKETLHRASNTAVTMANRPVSQPITARRGVPNGDGATKACISTKRGRVPSIPSKNTGAYYII